MTNPSSVRGGSVRFYPLRGKNLRTLACSASVRSVRGAIRTLAHFEESATSEACGVSSVRTDFSVRTEKATTPVWHAKKPTVSRARADFDRVNLQAAKIIAADPAKYAGGCLQWAQLVLARLKGERRPAAGPLFRGDA